MVLENQGFWGIIFFLITVWAIYKTIKSTASTAKKTIWVVVLVILPLLGFFAWLFFGPKG